jgi:hypothetical protein
MDQKNDEQCTWYSHLVPGAGGHGVMDLSQRELGSKTTIMWVFQTSEPLSSLPIAKWPKNNLQIHFTSSQWIKRMRNCASDTVIWSLVVMECWIFHRESLGQKQHSCTGEFFRLLSHNPPCQWPNDPRITCKSISPAPNGSKEWWTVHLRWSFDPWWSWSVGFVTGRAWVKNNSHRWVFQFSEPQSSLPMAKWPKNNLQIHFTSSQWI